MKTILFTCIGTSDPVRGYRDGPLLHILRHYRPEKVCVFLSKEAEELNRRGSRLEEVWGFVREHWAGYAPEVQTIRSEIEDPSDQDAVYEPIESAVRAFRRDNPDATLLLNLSSGTPQMKLVLELLSCEALLHARAVQVKSPEQKSGTTERTNTKDYDTPLELEYNEDENGAEARWVEPGLFALRQQQQRQQLLTLLQRRDYAALRTMGAVLPELLRKLTEHLYYRDRLQDAEAKRYAYMLKLDKLPFELYPEKKAAEESDYHAVSEAYLSMKNLLCREQYSLFVIRLNPLVLRLQLRALMLYLPNRGLHFDELFSQWNGEERFEALTVQQNHPEFYQELAQKMGLYPDARTASLLLCNAILALLPRVPADMLTLFRRCEKLNQTLRNDLAHQLQDTTIEELCNRLGGTPDKLVDELGGALAVLYPQCDRSLFRIYDRCDDYFRNTINE